MQIIWPFFLSIGIFQNLNANNFNEIFFIILRPELYY